MGENSYLLIAEFKLQMQLYDLNNKLFLITRCISIFEFLLSPETSQNSAKTTYLLLIFNSASLITNNHGRNSSIGSNGGRSTNIFKSDYSRGGTN